MEGIAGDCPVVPLAVTIDFRILGSRQANHRSDQRAGPAIEPPERLGTKLATASKPPAKLTQVHAGRIGNRCSLPSGVHQDSKNISEPLIFAQNTPRPTINKPSSKERLSPF